MRKFNLKEALAGQPVCTRDGKDVRILCSDFKNKSYSIVAAISLSEEEELLFCYPKDGKCSSKASSLDLFMKDKEYWVNLYSSKFNSLNIIGGIEFNSREEALKGISVDDYCGRYLDTVKVTEHEEN